jgi:peptidoglycan-associated lipoprotein
MSGLRFSLLSVVALALVVLAGCGGNPPPETDTRERTEPPPVVTDTAEEEAAEAARRAAEEDRLVRERAVSMLRDQVYFDFDRSELKPEARETLRRKAEVLRQYPDFRLRIEGHCDERGTVEYNLALGERRAEAARQYLVDLGIDPDRLTTVSYGEERPAIPGSNEAAWAQNRRDEFIPLGV